MPVTKKDVVTAEPFDGKQSPVTDFLLHLPVPDSMASYKTAVAESVGVSQCRCGEWSHFKAGQVDEACVHCGHYLPSK